MNINTKIAEFIATFCYIGKAKIAPGTFGSIAAFPICYIIMYFTLNNKIVFPLKDYNFQEQQIITLITMELLATIVLFFIGTYYTAIYIKDKQNKDPKEVVIDEVVGQMLTIILSSFSILLIYRSSLQTYFDSKTIDFIILGVMPFLLFRLFDITKPWPIDWLDKNIKGAWGVMIDDIAAAIFAAVAQYVIIFVILDFFPIATLQ
jgi:phosphatidylglycerophosphatase A